MDRPSARNFARETWALYGVGVLVIILRYVSRIRRFGIEKLRWDDYVMFNGLIWYTVLCIALNKIASGGGSNLISPEELAALTPETKAERVAGSKWVFISEHAMNLTIWSMKISMLILYAGITEGLRQRQYFNWLAVFLGAGFVGSELALFTICRPLNQYWAVPTNDPQCFNYQKYEIVQASFNIPSDIMMLIIAIPLLLQLRTSLRAKIMLIFVFGMGGFVIVAATLTKVYCLVPKLISYVYMNWYFREASVAVYVTNIPTLWPLVRDVTKYFGGQSSSGPRTPSHSLTFGQAIRTIGSGSARVKLNSIHEDLEMQPSQYIKASNHVVSRYEGSESQEHFNPKSSN